MRLALSSAHVFAWIFVFQYFSIVNGTTAALGRAALLYALTYLIHCLATPYAAQILRNGVKRAIIFATVVCATAFILLGAIFTGLFGDPDIGIVLFAVLLGLYRALYWIPYTLEVTPPVRGWRHFGREAIIAIAPLIGGIALAYSPVSSVGILFIAGILMLLASLPLMHIAEVYEGYSWGYRQTFQELVAPENRRILMHGILDGVTGASLLFLWPLAVFEILGRSYAVLGAVLTATFLITVILRRFVRELLKRANLHQSKLLHVVFLVSPWLLRTVVASPLGIILVDSYFYTTAPARQGVDPYAFEQSADGGTYLDEFTALKEMGQALGRVGICLIAATVAYTVSFPIAFIAAFAAAALVSIFVALRDYVN